MRSPKGNTLERREGEGKNYGGERKGKRKGSGYVSDSSRLEASFRDIGQRMQLEGSGIMG